MIKITGLDTDLISILKSSGKPISLNLGEVIKAQIVDIMPSGALTLNIKGSHLIAMSKIPLTKGETAFFKVIALPSESMELKLQFMGYVDKLLLKQDTLPFNSKNSPIGKLVQQLANFLHQATKPENIGNINLSKLENLNINIIKALPTDINSLPKDIRLKLQGLLQESIKITGESIHTRLSQLIQQLPAELKEHPVIKDIYKSLFFNIERLSETPLKSIFSNTGIMLEAKLKAIAQLFLNINKFHDDTKETKVLYQNITHDESFIKQELEGINRDLKAGLLKLRQVLIEENAIDKITSIGQKQLIAETSKLNSELINKISILIKDIECFQTLSKISDSFYTFLPFVWHNLRDGDVSFRQGKPSGKGMSYTCRVNLELEGYGKLSALVVLFNREFTIFFKTDNKKLHFLLHSNSQNLYEAFSAGGLKLKMVNFLDTKETIEHIEELQNEGNISIKA